MKLSKKLASALVIITTLRMGVDAHAGLVKLALRGGVNVYTPSITGITGPAGKNLVGGAGIVTGFGPASLLVDVLYQKNSATTVTPIPGFEQSLTYIQVPVQAQFSMGLFHFSGGMYYAKGLGNVSVTFMGTTTEDTFAGSGLKSYDYGAVGGLGISIPLGITTVSADIRYNYGLMDIDTDASTTYNRRSIDLLLGLTF